MKSINGITLLHFNADLFIKEDLNTLPGVIQSCKEIRCYFQAVIENNKNSCDGYDAYSLEQASERLLIARETYKNQLSKCIQNMESIIKTEPDTEKHLQEHILTFKRILSNV